MNIFDFILLIPPAYFCYKGIREGFVKRTLAILGLILGVGFSYIYHTQFAEFISDYWQNASVKYLAYLVPFLLVVLGVRLIAIAVTKTINAIALSPINTFFGALFGVVQGALISTIIALLVLVFNNSIDSPLLKLSQVSLLFGYFEDNLKFLLDFLVISI